MNRQKHKLSRRILAVLLMAAMLITMLPSAMFAQDGQAEGQTPVAVNNGSGEPQNSVTTSKDGIVINKSVDQIDNGYELTLEAYASEKTSTVTSTQPLDIVLVLDQSGSMADSFGGWGSGSRRAALQDAAEDFVNSVATNGGENHRIGIVTFDSGARVSKDFTYVSDEGVKDLNDTIDRLSADGATRVDLGLEKAKDNLLNKARSDAQKIVIVFTDGDPTSGSSFENEVAADAINTAKTIKDNGATIYTIGIFSGANPNTDNKSNNYMNAMSSNYPEATAVGKNPDFFGWLGEFSITWGERAEGNYYLAASNSEQLNAVFEQIYEEIGGLTSNPTAESVLSDTLSKYFVLPAGTDKDDITVEYVEAESYDENTGFTFEQYGQTPEGITVTIDGKTIEVTGFDYKAHVASAKLQDDGTYNVTGGKLVVKIPIELDSQAIKGTGIYDTNDTNQNKAGLDYFDKDGHPTDLKLDKSPSVAVTAYTVTYDWGEDAPEDVTLPVDNGSYLQGQSYNVDTTYSAGYTVKTYDEYGNVNGTYTFSGWTDSNSGVMGNSNVTITGSWTKEVVDIDSHGVTYSWENVPSGTVYDAEGSELDPQLALPTDETAYVKGQTINVDTTYTNKTVVYTKDAYGNINAKYTFSGWTVPNDGKMGDEDLTITGIWTKEDVYTIESIQKFIVASEDDLVATNPAIDLSGYTVPDGEGVVTIPEEGLGYVTLLYGITVEGTPGAPFTVRDDDATFVAANADDELSTGKDAVSGSQNEFFGTLPDDGEVTFYVSKPFEAKDIENGKISNTAFVVLEGDDNPKEATETTDATTEETPELPGNITALIGDKITVDCVNGDVEHADKVYGLIKDSFEVSKVYEENNKYYVDITLLKDHYNDYVEKYSEDMGKEHSLLNIGPDTKITLTWDGLKWVVPEQGLTVKVECVYGITDFDKFLVANNEQKKATDLTEEQLARFTFPDEKGRINLPKDGKVTLLYGITVTGDAGEEFTVTDENALLTPDIATTVENKDNGIFTGTIPEDGSITFYVEKVFTASDIDKDIVEGEESLVNVAEITEGDVVPGEKDDEEIVPVATGYSLTYEANGGYFANDAAKTTATVGELNPAQYDLWSDEAGTIPVDENGKELAKPIHAQAAPPEDTVISDADLVDVELIGWTTEVPESAGQIYAAGDKYPTLTDKATIEDDNVTVYAVWGYDENNDGVADATQVLITPADITAYTGGTPYGGIADINGNIITETDSGLPEPGYFITLPYDVQEWLNAQTGTTVGATNLHDYMTFTYEGDDGHGNMTTRAWGLEYQGVYETDADGTPLRYVYSLTPATVGDETIPVRLNYFKDTNNNGKLDETETALTNDDIIMSEDLAHDTFSMTINPGELDQSVIKATFNADGDTKDSTVGIGTGTLTVKSVTDVDTTTNAIGNSELDVTEDTLTAVAYGDVTYYVNDSQVDVDNKTDRVQLLVDSVSNNDEFNAQMGQHAIEAVEGSSDTYDYELAYMDLVDTANGNAEIKLGAGDELTIYWPMPENADPDGDFQVVHYTDMNREGTVDNLDAVTTQKLETTKVTVNGKDYLTFEVSSFSPFALVYTADDGSDTPDYPDYPIWTPDGDDDGPSGLNTEDHFSYVVGYAEDYRTGEATDNEDLWPVKPNNQITRAEVATIFYRLLEDEVRDEYDTTTNDFSDVTADSWYNQTVSTLARMGIVKGYEDGSFRPNAPITRAEFGAIATRFFAETGATYVPGTFTDVTGDEWYANAIQDAVNLGLIGGYPDGTVRPNNNITRAEACAIVNRTLGRVPDADHLLPEDVMKVWPDNNPTDWFYADMQEATNGHEYAWIEEDGHEIEEWTNLLDKDWTDR